MLRLLQTIGNKFGSAPEFWLADQFSNASHPMADKAIAAWTEFMGREAAELWLADRGEAGTQKPPLSNK